METILSLALGIGLAAACGFRIFVPFLVMSIAAHTGHLELAHGFAWIGTTTALVAFVAATLLEVLAYQVPWVDNLLDAAAGPIAVVAGVMVTASAVGDLDPLLRWSLAVIAGGGAAAIVQTVTTGLRQLSSATTLGLGNPLISMAEAGSSLALAVVAILAPLLAAALAVTALVALGLWLLRRRRALAAA
jgi:hypothetical protein